MRSSGLAIRSFSELCLDPNHTFGKYPSDYVLYEHGEFDELTGKFDVYDIPKMLSNGQEFVVSKKIVE